MTAPPPPRRLEYVRLDDVDLAPRNPKLHDAAGIARAIQHHGFGEVPLRDERTGRLVAGHGRHAQLLAMHANGDTPPDGIMVDPDGMWLMPLVAGWSSRSDLDAEAYLVGSNHLTTKAGWDDHSLVEILAELDGSNLLDLTGYDRGDFEAMEALFAAAPGKFSEDGFDDLSDYGDGDGDGDGDDGTGADGLTVLYLRVPPILVESWKSHLDTFSGDEVQAFAKLLDVDMADLDS